MNGGYSIAIPAAWGEPLRQYIEELQAKTPGSFVHVIMGHSGDGDTFWKQALHPEQRGHVQSSLKPNGTCRVTSVPYQNHHYAMVVGTTILKR